MEETMMYKGCQIRPVSTLLESGRYDLKVHIIEMQKGSTVAHTIPTFEETFQTKEEAIEFGFTEGKKLIDSI